MFWAIVGIFILILTIITLGIVWFAAWLFPVESQKSYYLRSFGTTVD